MSKKNKITVEMPKSITGQSQATLRPAHEPDWKSLQNDATDPINIENIEKYKKERCANALNCYKSKHPIAYIINKLKGKSPVVILDEVYWRDDFECSVEK